MLKEFLLQELQSICKAQGSGFAFSLPASDASGRERRRGVSLHPLPDLLACPLGQWPVEVPVTHMHLQGEAASAHLVADDGDLSGFDSEGLEREGPSLPCPQLSMLKRQIAINIHASVHDVVLIMSLLDQDLTSPLLILAAEAPLS